MADLLSTKAIYIRQEAPATCCIWFTCKGYLVYKRSTPSPCNLCTTVNTTSEVFFKMIFVFCHTLVSFNRN